MERGEWTMLEGVIFIAKCFLYSIGVGISMIILTCCYKSCKDKIDGK